MCFYNTISLSKFSIILCYSNFISILDQEFPMNLKFDNSYIYEEFKSYATSSEQTYFRCPNCPKVYRGKYTLARHLRLECGKSPTNKCLVCGQMFTHKHRLLSHIKSIHYEYYLNIIASKVPDHGRISQIWNQKNRV